MKVPLFDGLRVNAKLASEIGVAIERVCSSGQFILGAEVAAFEHQCEEALGVRHAIGVASGTDALVVGLRACGVQRGDLVVTSPFTFFATAGAVCELGAVPVFVDVDPGSMNVSVDRLDTLLRGESSVHRRLNLSPERICAVLPVHLFGRAADMQTLVTRCEVRDITLIGDAAQAFGSASGGVPVGSLGDAAAFSFFPTKNLGGFGDGGLVTTDDDEIARISRLIRTHGQSSRYQHSMLGTNSRLDAVQAAILAVKLRHIDDAIDERKTLARRYDSGLSDVNGLSLPVACGTDGQSVPNQYTVRIFSRPRDAVVAMLTDLGVEARVYYPLPLHVQPALQFLGYGLGDFPVAEALSRSVISLPIFPGMTVDEQDFVISAVRRAMASQTSSERGSAFAFPE